MSSTRFRKHEMFWQICFGNKSRRFMAAVYSFRGYIGILVRSHNPVIRMARDNFWPQLENSNHGAQNMINVMHIALHQSNSGGYVLTYLSTFARNTHKYGDLLFILRDLSVLIFGKVLLSIRLHLSVTSKVNSCPYSN